ncbi:hypothetical protein LEMLEM_LOCUS22741 [Lemmus lemmus]
MQACLQMPPSRATGAAWLTGSTGRAWAASMRCTTRPSASSTTYLRAAASAWASSTWSSAVSRCGAHAARSASASCSARSQTACGPTTGASTPSSLTPPRWTRLEAAPWSCARCRRATPSRCSTLSAQGCCSTQTPPMAPTTHTACASASPRAGDPATHDSSSPPAPVGWRSSSTTTDSTEAAASPPPPGVSAQRRPPRDNLALPPDIIYLDLI